MVDIFALHYAPYREALAAFEILRRLGFSADSIAFRANFRDHGEYAACIVLKTQGKTFTIKCGILKGDQETIRTTWDAISGYWNATTSSLRNKIYLATYIQKQSLQLLVDLRNKGFKIPAL